MLQKTGRHCVRFSFKKNSLVLFLVLFSLQTAVAAPLMGVLEYHQNERDVDATALFTDRAREQMRRDLGMGVLGRAETDGPFYYHKKDVLEENRSQSRLLLEQGKQAYFNLRLSEAVSLFQQVIALDDDETLIDAYLLLGLSRFAAKEKDLAQEAFYEALRRQPDKELDPNFFPPKLNRFFSKLKKEWVYETGSLEIKGTPHGAEVFLNGILRGVVPMRLEKVPTGVHRLRVRANRYTEVDKTINIVSGEVQKESVELSWKANHEGRPILGFSTEEVGESALAYVGKKMGEEMGVSKILFVSYLHHERGQAVVEGRLVDVVLGTEHEHVTVLADKISKRSDLVAMELSQRVRQQLGQDLALNPEKYGHNRYVGDVILVGRHRPFYKRWWFWTSVGTVAAGGVAAGLLLQSSSTVGGIGVGFR